MQIELAYDDTGDRQLFLILHRDTRFDHPTRSTSTL
jgi:hypothetical protein